MANEYAYADAVAKAIDRLDVRLRVVERRDGYDVQAMVDKGDNAERAARQRHIADVARDLRAEFRREVIELREEMGELFAQMHGTIKSVSDACDNGDNAILRILNERTADKV